MDDVEQLNVVRISQTGREEAREPVVREYPFTILVNSEEVVTLLCSPSNLKSLAVGFLSSEGILASRSDFKKVVVDEAHGLGWVEVREELAEKLEKTTKRLITSGCGKGASLYSTAGATGLGKVSSDLQVSFKEIRDLVLAFQSYSETYKTTHGVHSAALCDSERIIIFRDDIGRHNAVDKVFGECMLNDITTRDRIFLISGRISSEMVSKVARRQVPVLVSISAPTNLGVRLARDLDVTLVASARQGSAKVHSGSWRLKE